MGFNNFLREYFTFNRRQRNGVFVLLSIILLLVLWLSFSDLFFSPEKTDFSQFEREVSEFEAGIAAHPDSLTEKQNYFASSNTPEPEKAELFPFDPNNLPEQDWKRLGLSEKQIRVIKNYEGKGGKFRSKEDVKKMYCISPQLYSSLEPFVKIQHDTTRREAKTPLSLWSEAGDEAIELNSADTTALISLKGIGSAFAKRIVKYRESLGGFIRKEQLLEVYGLDRERYDGFSSAVFLDISKIKMIQLNSVSAEALKLHPYIRYNLANLIVNYRKQHGNYKSVEDIRKLDLVNDEIYAKLAPYLSVE